MKLPRYAPIAIVFVLSFLGCNLSKLSGSNAGNAAPKASPAASVKTGPTAEPTKSEKTHPQNILEDLKKTAGKYPHDVRLLDTPELKPRLQKLLGPDIAALRANWNVETPIEVSGNVLMASACQQHNCAANTYYLFIDLADDNINVVHVENGKQVYNEKGSIELPKKFADAIAETESDQ